MEVIARFILGDTFGLLFGMTITTLILRRYGKMAHIEVEN